MDISSRKYWRRAKWAQRAREDSYLARDSGNVRRLHRATVFEIALENWLSNHAPFRTC